MSSQTEPELPETAESVPVFDALEAAQPLTGFDRKVDRAGRYVSVLFLLAVLISFFEIVMRYAFNAPTIWVHETVIAMVAVCYAFGGAFALARDSHIRISLIYGLTGPRARRFLDIVNAVMTLLFALTLGWAAFLLAEKAWFSPTGALSLDRSGSAWNPPTPAIIKAILLLCLILMSVQAVVHLLKLCRRTKTDGGEG